MRLEKQVAKIFTRRMLIIGAFKAFLFLIIFIRLFYLQIINWGKFATLSDKNRIRFKAISPERGLILDSQDNILVVNKTYYKLFIDTTINKHITELKNKIIDLLSLDQEQIEQVEQNILKPKNQGQLLVMDNVSWEHLSIIELHNLELPGVYIESGRYRHYPFAELCSHLIGYVSSLSKDDADYERLKRYDLKIGKSGIEKTFDHLLRGAVGFQQIEVDAYGNLIRELSTQEPEFGQNIKLSINLELQQAATSLLEGKDGAITLMNCQTGQVIAMCSSPGYNPNILSHGITLDYWNKIINDKHFPLINKSISRTIAPGSVFKLVVALAALEHGISPDDRHDCQGTFYLGNHAFHCWKRHKHGPINLKQAIQHSCNIYFYYTAKILGIDAIAATARKLGLGQPTQIDLPHESTGLIPNKKWKKKRFKQDWTVGDSINVAIGHGYLLVTPIQLAVMAARIASGKELYPKIFTNNTDFANLDIAPEHLEIIREAMHMAVNQAGGTVFRFRNDMGADYEFAAKTGTSQVIAIQRDASGKALDNKSWETSHHGLCIGFGPYKTPKFACSVMIEHGGSGAGAAAPVLSELLKLAMKLDKDGLV
ncbi:penicillin-binding protein 2 [Rickettsiales endosymbiont of Stachyamoeba lipophora]|uniref:penicillin-binding protein 2 n=1 Tax=Rickettsiales endosymbiont of Stachyamoeba lipophora TaxID=2486578 RepID=UPI000F6467C8|nr:penicillin-binding protein 2 [Rickettsiales endosymbiont of Stachyamoeba lipophora]AZL16064.1 penicillin-binding protein 2 [Rickettsiales endosymbiont of Stachyamoeba lipophora]